MKQWMGGWKYGQFYELHIVMQEQAREVYLLTKLFFFEICVITQIKINNNEIGLFECESYNDSFKNYVDKLCE